jgi:hypothetical protein
MVTIEDNTILRVRFEKFTDDVDQLFEPSFFDFLEKILMTLRNVSDTLRSGLRS